MSATESFAYTGDTFETVLPVLKGALDVVHTPEQITLIASSGTHIGQMYSIFPEKGIGFFTMHKYLPFEGGIPNTATFLSTCKVVADGP